MFKKRKKFFVAHGYQAGQQGGDPERDGLERDGLDFLVYDLVSQPLHPIQYFPNQPPESLSHSI